MNTLYAIKDKKSGRYFTNNAKSGSFYVNLNEASFYRTTEGAQKTIATSRFVRTREADPTVVEIRLTEVEPSGPIEMLYAVTEDKGD